MKQIDFSQNTLCRRYTRTDLYGSDGKPGLTKGEIDRQNRVMGFDPHNQDFPIRVVRDVDSLYFRQGQGPILIVEPDDTYLDADKTSPYWGSHTGVKDAANASLHRPAVAGPVEGVVRQGGNK